METIEQYRQELRYIYWKHSLYMSRKNIKRCNIVNSFSSFFVANVNITGKWKYWYVRLMLGYRFSNSNVKMCTIVFKMYTKKCEREAWKRNNISITHTLRLLFIYTLRIFRLHITRLPELWTEISPQQLHICSVQILLSVT